MNKKIIAFICGVAFITINVTAQNFNVQSAYNYMRYNEIDKAKDAIDKAAEHETTANDPKMWAYRSKIYYQIFTDPKWSSLDPDAAAKSANSIIKVYETDEKDKYKKDMSQVMGAAVGLYNLGIEAEKAEKYAQAKEHYELLSNLMEYDDKKVIARNNITPEIVHLRLYTIADAQKNYPEAKKHLQILMDQNYNDPAIYFYMSNMLLAEGDTAKALEVLSNGRNIYDDNAFLLQQEIYLYDKLGRTDELVTKLSEAITKDDQNEIYYYNRGTIYLNGNQTTQAEADLIKAIELRPDYYDALINLGAIYGAQANAKIEKMNALNMNQQKEYDKLKRERDELFRKTAEYWQRAIELPYEDPNAMQTLTNLREVYVKVGDYENAKKIKEKMSEVKTNE